MLTMEDGKTYFPRDSITYVLLLDRGQFRYVSSTNVCIACRKSRVMPSSSEQLFVILLPHIKNKRAS